MTDIVLVIHVLLAIALIGVVLLQRSEGGGLGIGGGGGGGGGGGMSGFLTGRGAATALTKLTAGLAAAFMVTSILLSILAANRGQPTSIIQDIPVTTPLPDSGSGGAEDGPAVPLE
jgi:preprotein translocase subunit SecG